MEPVFGQDGPQVPLARDRRAVEELAAQHAGGAILAPGLVSSPWIRRYPTADSPPPGGRRRGRCCGSLAGGPVEQCLIPVDLPGRA
jgi:hypothetical protein